MKQGTAAEVDLTAWQTCRGLSRTQEFNEDTFFADEGVVARHEHRTFDRLSARPFSQD